MELYIMYLRKSQLDRDFENESVEETLKRHKKTLTEFAKAQNLYIAVILEEVVSGESLSARPQMLKCLELVNTGEYAGVICMDIDRLSRGSSLDSGYITQVFQLNGCKIVTPHKTYDLLNESDEQFTDMKFMFSRYEHKTITKRLVRGRRDSVAEGKVVFSTAPYGYEIYKLKGVKGNSMRIVPEQAKVVRMIFDMYTEQGKGYNTIVYELNQLHIPSLNGKPWSQSSVVNIITNETYTGKTVWGKSKIKKTIQNGELKKKRVMQKDYNVFEGMHEPIITQEQFDKAVRIRKNKGHDSSNIHKTIQNPFAGMMYCHKCGGTIKRNVADKGHNTAPWYRCPTRGCDCAVVKCDVLEKAVVAEMTEWLKNYTITIDTSTTKKDTHTEDALSIIQKKLADLHEQQDKICDLLEKGVYTVQMFQKRNDALSTDISKLQDDEAVLIEKLKSQKDTNTTRSEFIPKVQHLLDSYDKLNPKQKNELWKQVLEKVTFAKEKGAKEFELHLYPRIPQ